MKLWYFYLRIVHTFKKDKIHSDIHKDELESFTMSKTDPHLLRQKVRQKISVNKTNTFDDSSFWHFDSGFVLKTRKTQVFVMTTEIF